MFQRADLRRATASVAATALLLAALLPALSSWWTAVRQAQSPWLVLCSEHNPLYSAPTRAADPAGDDGSQGTKARCPLCLSLACAPVLPPAASAILFVTGLAHAVPQLFLRAAEGLFTWAPVRSRGPPSGF